MATSEPSASSPDAAPPTSSRADAPSGPPATAALDDAPFSPFHRRIAIYSCGGPFCDGYILGIIAVALTPLAKDIGLTASGQGLIGAATLAGMFVGGSLFGYVTDVLGRQ